ncbi:MAG: type II toxin-antitoxin system HicA family toxin [Proteobacteria bacterium]|nr:type II toxin-antitoxin system HicA family toxin [Pseudomonadota bacterium]
MPELYSSDYIISVLIGHGFQEVSQKGSHKKFHKGNRRVVVPSPRREIPVGTFYSILRQSGLSKSDFKK